MQQMMHIFRKDVRALFPQIALAVLLLGAYVWTHAGAGSQMTPGASTWWILVQEYGGVLVVLGWLALIVRVIMEEPQVGDRHFWLTRPYEWKSLLGAKLLFILVFINVPLFIAQMLFVGAAGFSPFPHWSDLLLMQLYDVLLIVLPAIVAAAISSSVGRTMFVMLGVVLYVAVLAFAMPNTPSSSTSNDSDGFILAIVLVGAALLVIYWQYSGRAITKSARLIIAAGILLPLISLLIPWNALVARDFPPLAAGASPAVFRIDPSHAPAPKFQKLPDKADVEFPVLTSLPEGAFLKLQNIRLHLEGQNRIWDSGWTSSYQTIYPGENRFTVTFQLPASRFQWFRNGAVSARLSFAISEYKASNTQSLVVSDEFNIPNVGPCRLASGRIFSAECVAATRKPAMLLAIPAGAGTCPAPKGEDRVAQYAWEGPSDPDPGIDPVQRFTLWFQNGTLVRNESNVVCPGTKILLSDIKQVRSFQTHLEENIRLEDFRHQDITFRFGR